MEKLVTNGYAEKAEQTSTGNVWYIPHHAVYHPSKGTIRVVFDCPAKFQGICLNDELLSGPDLTNSLLGVLMRFRKESIAFTADIESMFIRHVCLLSNKTCYNSYGGKEVMSTLHCKSIG